MITTTQAARSKEYETIYVLRPDIDADTADKVQARVSEVLARETGTLMKVESWGRRKLAYEIDKKEEGAYHFLTFDAEPETLDEVSRVLRIADDVMRHLAVHRIASGSRSAPPPTPVMTAGPPERRGRSDRGDDRDAE